MTIVVTTPLGTNTALDILKRAMRLAGVYSIGEEPSADETASGLMALNGMIGTWANEALMIYAHTRETIPLVAGTNFYTLGETGTVVTTRPIEILDSAYIVYQDISYPCPRMTVDQFNSIPFKMQTAEFPWAFYYQDLFPDGRLRVYPTPTNASIFFMTSKKQLAGFSSLTDAVSLPPGYFDALCFNMATYWCPEFDGASIPPQVMQQAINTKRLIKRTNTKPLVMNLPAAVLPQNGFVNWRTGA
jgi:hypothetical protein